MAAAAGEQLSFDSALAATLQDLNLTFYFTILPQSTIRNTSPWTEFRRSDYVTFFVALIGCRIALSDCVQRELERQSFIPPTLPMEQRQTRYLSDVGLACQAMNMQQFFYAFKTYQERTVKPSVIGGGASGLSVAAL